MVGGKKVIALGDKGAQFWMFDRETGQEIWNRPTLSPSRDQAHGGLLNNGAFDGKYFYGVSNDPGTAPGCCTSSIRRWTAQTCGMPPKSVKTNWSPVTLANGLLFVPSDSELLVMNAATGDVLICSKLAARSPRGAGAWSTATSS